MNDAAHETISLIRFGHYDVPSFFSVDGGVYGNYNVTALVSYLLGVAVVSPVYYFAVRLFARPQTMRTASLF
jgi:cytosine/uracil/thiamine/allantoin permease